MLPNPPMAMTESLHYYPSIEAGMFKTDRCRLPSRALRFSCFALDAAYFVVLYSGLPCFHRRDFTGDFS
jgi:hypothetical protein